MFRTFSRLFLPNPLDWMLRRCAKRGGRKILLGWNRGLGDIALGLFAIVQRVRELVPNADITFLTRPNLRDGFSMLEGVTTLVADGWQRGPVNVKQTLHQMGINPKTFDLVIERPSPTDWVRWQRGKVVPRLRWDARFDSLYEKFCLPDGFIYIGVQAVVETKYGAWRNWPHWKKLLDRLELLPHVKVLLFGAEDTTQFHNANIIDLRGKTMLFELLSIIKNKCRSVILPDSGVLSMVYYLNALFPLQVISLWADADHGILKQNVASPNTQLTHNPLIGNLRDLSSVSVDQVIDTLFPVKPLTDCPFYADVPKGDAKQVGCILMAGGQGSRLGMTGPKGCFTVCGKSLFQWVCEKVPKGMPIAVMTSPLNHEETVAFFAQHENFGREVYFFEQAMQPFLDEQKQPMQELAPSGNGAVFRAFVESGIFAIFAEKGIDLVTIVPVDNPLADPADLFLIGYARQQNADVTIKCIKSEKQMGVLVEKAGHIEITEYTELDPKLEYAYSYTGMMAIGMPFLQRMAETDLPMHWVKKKTASGEWAWKGEQFIFDVLPFGRGVALWYPKKDCYAPIKGPESIENVRQLLVY